MLKGRGDKTVNPRSFTPRPRVAPVFQALVTKDKFRLGSVLVTSNKEELSFQPGLQAFRPENYKVTDFSHQTTPQGHTYRCGYKFLFFCNCLRNIPLSSY